MKITREQYEADIRAAKRAAWDEGFIDKHFGTHDRDDNPYSVIENAWP